MIDRHTLKKPTAGACCRCGAPLAGDDIFHWSPGSWSIWCFREWFRINCVNCIE